MTVTIEQAYNPTAHRVIVTEPTAAVVAMAQRMAADSSTMIDGWVERDGTVVMTGRGARGDRLYAWATDQARAAAAAPAAHHHTSTSTARGPEWCSRCGGPTSVYGQICYECSVHA